jgi:membrane-associated phospholipid phosphatase
MLSKHKLERKVIDNFTKIKLKFLFFPFLFLLLILFTLYSENAFTVEEYINFQKDYFFYLNKKLAVFPNLQFNLTQLGDVLIFFPFVSISILFTPKLWRSLLISGLISLVFSATFKKIFAVPRPAAIFDNESFTIIGKTLTGSTSLPSGHTIATFIVITIVLLAFMPKKAVSKILWTLLVLALGYVIAFSRVGVGAHYPFDVLIGSVLGCVSAILGIIINNNINWGSRLKNKKYYPIYLLLLFIWIVVIASKIWEYNLIVFYLSILSLVITMSLMLKVYVKK